MLSLILAATCMNINTMIEIHDGSYTTWVIYNNDWALSEWGRIRKNKIGKHTLTKENDVFYYDKEEIDCYVVWKE